MRTGQKAWVVVSVLAGALVACTKTDREGRTFYANGAASGTVAAEIMRRGPGLGKTDQDRRRVGPAGSP